MLYNTRKVLWFFASPINQTCMKIGNKDIKNNGILLISVITQTTTIMAFGFNSLFGILRT